MRQRPSQIGFTLLEVMVVVGIIGILAVIAIPNLTGMLRRSELRAEARRLYGVFNEAQGLAGAEGVSHCLLLDWPGKTWSIRRNQNDDGACDASDPQVTVHGGGNGPDAWPSHVALGPGSGISTSLPVPYDGVAVDAWCTPCGATNPTGALFFDVDGRILDAAGDVIANGSVMLYDETGQSDSLVEVLMFIGPTGNVRLFSVAE